MGTSNALVKLHNLSAFVETGLSVDEGLQALAGLAAQTLNARHSVIMLNEGGNEEMKLRAVASFGKSTWTQLTEALCETATQVISTGRPLLLEDCDATQSAAKPAGLICAPIQASAKTIGALQLAAPRFKRAFTADDLSLLELVALFVGKSLHILQLQNILNSRFTQIALAQEADRTIGSALAANGEDADRVAKILAKSFYREMAKAGFSSNQIIGAASEIISQLSANLQKHTKRIVRG